MKEPEWLTSNDPEGMLTHIFRKASSRKLRLFACACVRRAWPLLRDPRSQRVVEKAEAFADGLITVKELASARAATPGRDEDRVRDWVAKAATDCAISKAWFAVMKATDGVARSSTVQAAERHEQAAVLREIIGNPFRKTPLPEHWSDTVQQLAESLYKGEDCAFALHDALLESGQAEFAEHFRDASQWHPKGCWAVDLILGKK
jgi:hypothetical protein